MGFGHAKQIAGITREYYENTTPAERIQDLISEIDEKIKRLIAERDRLQKRLLTIPD